MTKQKFSGSYLIDGTTFTQSVVIEIEPVTPHGSYHGRTNLNGNVFDSKGTWNTRTFHNEWIGGEIDGIVSSETGDIIGVIRLGIKTGSVTLTVQSNTLDND